MGTRAAIELRCNRIAVMVRDGKTVAEIAAALGVSTRTVYRCRWASA